MKIQFAGSRLFSFASAFGSVDEAFAPGVKCCTSLCRRVSSNELATVWHNLFDVGPNFSRFNKVARVGGRDAPFDTLTKLPLVVQEAQGSFLYKLPCAGAVLLGDLQKLGFLFGGELDLHKAKRIFAENRCGLASFSWTGASEFEIGRGVQLDCRLVNWLLIALELKANPSSTSGLIFRWFARGVLLARAMQLGKPSGT